MEFKRKTPQEPVENPGCFKCKKCKVACPVLNEGTTFGGQRQCKYDNLTVQIIDQVPNGEKIKLAQKETFWQHQLRCYVENGGHAHCYRKDMF